MSEIIEKTYKNYLGIDKEDIDFVSGYTPVPNKYVTISTDGSPSRNYLYYRKVVDLIEWGDIEVIQIGTPETYNVGRNFKGKTLRQNSFIIENSLLHIGNEHIFREIAKNKKVPVVTLFSPTPAPKSTDQEINIESSRNGLRPSYRDDNDDTINLIKPEEVAKAICKILKLKLKIESFETVKINKDYLTNRIEFVPDFLIGPNQINGLIVCRFDISNDYNSLVNFYRFYGAPLFTEDPLPLDFLAANKQKIPTIVYLLDRNYSKQFVEVLHKSGIPYELATTKSGKALADLKLELFDFNQVKVITKPDIGNVDEDMFFETNRLFLSKGALYASRFHLAERTSIRESDFRIGPALHSKLFLESWDSFYIYKK